MIDILSYLPQKAPSIWVDRVIDIDPLTKIVGLKNLSFNDPIFDGHFTDHPMLPNTVLIDALSQVGSLLFLQDPEYSGRLSLLSQIEGFEFLTPAVPGDQLRLEADVLKIKEDAIRFSGRVLVEGRVIAEGKFFLRLAQKPTRPQIHPTASVHATAILGKDVVIGPFSIVGENVVIGDNTILEAHVMVEKWTKIGSSCHIHFGCVIGSDAQDVKYNGEKTWVVIGDHNEIREYVTINRSTGKDTITEIGSHNIFLTHVHIAHNCKIGNHVIIANMTNLGGHTHVDDLAVIGGMTGVHQFVRIGRGAMVGAYTRLPQDVPPYTLCEGNPAYIRGLNLVGLKRRNVAKPAIVEIKELFRILFRSDKNTSQALKEIRALTLETPEAKILSDFVQVETSRGFLKKEATASGTEEGH